MSMSRWNQVSLQPRGGDGAQTRTSKTGPLWVACKAAVCSCMNQLNHHITMVLTVYPTVMNHSTSSVTVGTLYRTPFSDCEARCRRRAYSSTAIMSAGRSFRNSYSSHCMVATPDRTPLGPALPTLDLHRQDFPLHQLQPRLR